MAKKNYQIEVFHPSFLHAATVGGRGVCVLQTCTGAVSLQNRTRRHNAPHATKQMAAPMCISDLCRSSAVSPPPAGGIGVRVLPASAVLISNGDACAFLAQQEKPKRRPILVLFRRIFRFSFCTSHEIQHFCASDVVVATLVAM